MDLGLLLVGYLLACKRKCFIFHRASASTTGRNTELLRLYILVDGTRLLRRARAELLGLGWSSARSLSASFISFIYRHWVARALLGRSRRYRQGSSSMGERIPCSGNVASPPTSSGNVKQKKALVVGPSPKEQATREWLGIKDRLSSGLFILFMPLVRLSHPGTCSLRKGQHSSWFYNIVCSLALT